MNQKVSFVTLFKKTFKEFGDDKVSRLSAAFSYYVFTAFFPLLLVLIALVGIALSFNVGAAEDARAQVLQSVQANLPAAAPLLSQSFEETEQSSGLAGFIALLTGLWTASNIFAQLDEAFNIIYDVAPRKRTFKETLKARGQAALIVLLIAVLMIGSFIFSTVIATATGVVESLPGGATMAWVLNLLLSLTLSSGVFALLFKFIPDKPVTWKAALIGGVFTSVTWQIGREALTWYLGSREVPGAGEIVGAVLAFLALVYYASLILMFGAQLTATYDELANPDLVRDKTADDSALQGPGAGVVAESGETVKGTAGKGNAATSKSGKGAPPKSGSAKGSGSKRSSSKSSARARIEAAPRSVSTFSIGFVTGIAALLVGVRTLLGRVGERVRG